MALYNLARLLAIQERDEEAEATFREALAVRVEHWGPGHWQVGQGYYALGTFFLTRGDTLAAAESYRKTVEIYTEALGADHGWTAHAKAVLATCLVAERRYDEAERRLLEAYRIIRDSPSAEAYAEDALERIVFLYQAWGKPEKAEEYRALLSGTTE
jgi:tetratricopeptide (TPR) repeat protein